MRAPRTPWLHRSLIVSSLGFAIGLSAVGNVARAKDPSLATDSGASLSATEAAVVARTNDARAKRGLGPLAADASLMNGARRQASWMARHRSLSHGQGVTENIAMGQSSASEAVADWMRSDGHRANILGPHSRIGVAMARAADGTVYWCQQFR